MLLTAAALSAAQEVSWPGTSAPSFGEHCAEGKAPVSATIKRICADEDLSLDLHEQHHTVVLVRQNVTVQHETTDVALEAGANHYETILTVILPRRNVDRVHPQARSKSRIAAVDDLKRVDVDMEWMSGVTIVL